MNLNESTFESVAHFQTKRKFAQLKMSVKKRTQVLMGQRHCFMSFKELENFQNQSSQP